MNNKKWFAPILPYFAVWVGLFVLKNAWLALAGFHLAILIVLLWLRPTLPFGVLFKRTQWKYVLPNVLLCALSGLGLFALWNFLGMADNLRDQLHLLGLNETTWFGLIAYFSLVNPFVEEYFWRGVLGNGTNSFYLGDLIYAGYHVIVVWNKTQFYTILLMLFALVFAGWFWRQVYHKDGSLLAPLLGHMAADFSILFAVYWVVG